MNSLNRLITFYTHGCVRADFHPHTTEDMSQYFQRDVFFFFNSITKLKSMETDWLWAKWRLI